MAQLRTDVAARVLLERLLALAPMTEAEAVDVLESRARGRADEIIASARGGIVRRIPRPRRHAGDDHRDAR